MSTPSPDDQPTRVLPQPTAEQPSVSAAPATRRTRIWGRKVPAHLGRARTSTVVIGCLFVLLSGLNTALPEDPYVSVPLPNGDTVRVRSSQISPASTPAPTTAPATTEEAPVPSSTPAETTTPPPTTSTPETTTSGTSSAPQRTTGTSTSAATTSRAPSTSEETSPTAGTPTATSAPTS